MGRWVIEVTSMGGSLVLNHSPIGLSSALILMVVGMVAMLSIVFGMCAQQLHSRVQNREGSDEEMSAASRADHCEPGGGGGERPGRRGKKCGGGSKGEQGKKCINMSFGDSTKRLVSKRGLQEDEEVSECEDDEEAVGDQLGVESGAVWKRSILMGERCEPPAFSGLILYDEHGNLVQDLPWRSPRHPASPSLRQLLTST